MGMGNFSLSWVCHPLDTTDWGEEDPAFWKLPNESRAIFKLLKSHWTKNPNHKRKACLSFLRWFMVPHVMHWQYFCMYHEGRSTQTMFLYVSQGQVLTDNVSICIMRAGAHWQHFCMYHESRCALTTFLYVPWGQEHTDNVSVCITRASMHWQCFYISQGQMCTDNVSVCITGQVHTDNVSVHITGQVHTDNVSVCIMRADVHWQCFCVHHEGRSHWQCFCMYPKLLWVVSESNLRVRSFWILVKNKKFLRLLNIFIINTCFDMSWL